MPDFFTVAGIFVGEFLGGSQRERLLFGHRLPSPHLSADVIHGVDGIYGRWASIGERAINQINVRGEFF